uniref:Rho-GAP domain-containing protein n=1 Tax=Strongyloides stercoralis TaxID=6248 RepID=A0A0K0DUY4_STRER
MEGKPIPLPRTSLLKKKELVHSLTPPPIPERPKNILKPPPIPPRHKNLFYDKINNLSSEFVLSSSSETIHESEYSMSSKGDSGSVLFQNPEYVSIENLKICSSISDDSEDEAFSIKSQKEQSIDTSECYSDLKGNHESTLEPVFVLQNDEKDIDSRVSIRADPIMGLPDRYDGEKITFYGWIEYKNGRKTKKYWGALKDGYLKFYDNEECSNNPIFSYNLADLVYVGKNISIPYCIIVLLRSKDKAAVWGRIEMITEEDQFKTWTHLLARSVVPSIKYDNDEFSDLDFGGIVWFKEGTTAQWSQGWLYISKKTLNYMKLNMVYNKKIDIRKIRCLKKNICKTDWCPFVYNTNDGPIVCSQGGNSFYMQGENDICTDLWYENISNELLVSDNTLEGQRLTDDNIPYIVDKCMKFISTYGKTVKGLYRRNGSTLETRTIAEGLRKDPPNYQILREREETVFAVADALRGFLRQLDKPVISTNIHQELYNISNINENSLLFEKKNQRYSETLKKLELVNYNTLKNLICHLREITDNSDKNFATIDNISKIFAPTLFSVDKHDEDISLQTFTQTTIQMIVLRDLLNNYKLIFPINDENNKTAAKIEKAIEEINTIKALPVGLLVPIHLYHKDNQCFNVQATIKAAEVCSYASGKINIQNSTEKYDLFEVIKGGALKRKIRSDETLAPIVAKRWLDYDHKECFLLYAPDLYPLSLTNHKSYVDDVKIADPGSKNFKTCHLKLETMNNEVYVIQLNKSMKPIGNFNIKDLLWFDGHESDRKPPYEHTLTLLVTSTKFKYKSKFIGYCIAFKEPLQKLEWLNEIFIAPMEYNQSPILQY